MAVDRWNYCLKTTPVSTKDYICDASVIFLEHDLAEGLELSPEDQRTVEKARAEEFKILKGTQYLRLHGKWEGHWASFVAREDMNDICRRYGLYQPPDDDDNDDDNETT